VAAATEGAEVGEAAAVSWVVGVENVAKGAEVGAGFEVGAHAATAMLKSNDTPSVIE